MYIKKHNNRSFAKSRLLEKSRVMARALTKHFSIKKVSVILDKADTVSLMLSNGFRSLQHRLEEPTTSD